MSVFMSGSMPVPFSGLVSVSMPVPASMSGSSSVYIHI